MRKRCYLCALMLMAGLSAMSPVTMIGAAATAGQEKASVKVAGLVVDKYGEPVPGVGIIIKNTKQGVTTDVDGKFTINSSKGTVLIVSALGYATQEIVVDGSSLKVVLEDSAEQLADVIVTGVARGTSRATLPFTVEKISEASIQEVTGNNVAVTLAGKMPGVKISYLNGNPGSEPVIKLRGGTSFDSNSQPLIIVDGIVTEGSLKDINMEDVEDIEVIKGAAAASFYGSKAAGGVVHIITKRGASLENGTVRVTFKTEEGPNWLGFRPQRSTAHGYVVGADGLPTTTMEDDTIWDNKWPGHDSYKDIFVPRFYASNTLGLTGRSKSGDINYYASVQNTKNPGVVKLLDGQNRTSFRVNMDARLSDKVSFNTSNLFVRTITDERSINFDDVYYSDYGADFLAKNLDGTDYKVNPNVVTTRNNINPLYDVANKRAESTGNRFLGSYGLRYIPTDWLSFNAVYSIDYSQKYQTSLVPKGRLTVNSPDGTDRSTGDVSNWTSNAFKHNVEASALFTKKFGDFNTNVRLQYLYEDTQSSGFSGGGSKLAVSGLDIISLDQADPETLDITSWGSRIVSNSMTAVFQGDWKEEYMLDALVRRDGSSVLGDDARWQTYYRVSAAWNAAKTFKIPHVDLLKPRVSYGTAGILPAYGAKYEVYSMSNGSLYGGSQLGNRNLKPALSKELEIGVDARLFDRVTFDFAYSHKKNVDMPYAMSVSGVTGFEYQYLNIGEFFTNAYELSVGVDIIRKKNFSWDVYLTWDKLTQRIGELGRPDFYTGSGALLIASHSKYGEMYGTKFARSLDEVSTSKEIKPGQSVGDVFCINNYGFVVRKKEVGTIEERHMSVLDENGSNAKVSVGNMLPDFNANITSTFRYKGLMCYFTLSGQKGGLLYNNTRLYMSFAGRNAAFWDMSERDWENRKPLKYNNQHSRESFIEDASFIKLREFALNYSFNAKQLEKVGIGFFKGVKLGVIGRNLLTLTRYSGPDPETDTYSGSILEGTDTPKYPSDIRTVSGTITVEF